MGKMRKILLLHSTAFFFILNLSLLAFAPLEVESKNAKTLKEEQISNITKKNYNLELSTAVSFGLKIEPWIDNSLKTLILNIPARVGFFIEKNIEIEPEIGFIFENSDSSFNTNILLLGNLSYNLNNYSHLTPFILIGVGIIRIPVEYSIDFEERTKTNFAKNIGVGLKWLITERVALRIEYRLINYKENADNIFYNNISLGFSHFFNL